MPPTHTVTLFLFENVMRRYLEYLVAVLFGPATKEDSKFSGDGSVGEPGAAARRRPRSNLGHRQVADKAQEPPLQ
jgi:hypothetical protein